MSGIDRDPGFFENDGSATALVDQQRAEALDALRTSQAVSVTWLEPDGDGVHWAFHAHDAHGADAFLLYAVCKAWRDAQAALGGIDHIALAAIVLAALNKGVGE